MGDYAPESSDDEDEPTSVTQPVAWDGAGIDFGALEERFEKHVKGVAAFHPTGDAARDFDAYVAFEGALADEVKQLRDDDGDLAHPLKAAVCDRRSLRRYAHRLLRALTDGEALGLVDKAANGDAAVAALRKRYDARHSKAAQSRVSSARGEAASPFEVTWDRHYKFEYADGGDGSGQNPGKIMEVCAKNGCVVRKTSGMTSDIVAELPQGTLVYAARQCCTMNDKGKNVNRMGIARPVHGYVSLKMLKDTTRKPPKEFYDPTAEELEMRAKEQERGEE
jgi:hypothetical protein